MTTKREPELKWQTVVVDGKTYRASVHFGCYWRVINGKAFGGTRSLTASTSAGRTERAVWLAAMSDQGSTE
jgi:hypothetical protein